MTYHVSHLLTMPANIEGINVDVVLDTGAAVNIVSGTFAQRTGRPIRPATSTVRGVGGELANSAGVVELNVHVGPTHTTVAFLVLNDCPYEVLCGLPFCADTQLVLDFPRNLISLQGHLFPLRIERSLPPMEKSKTPLNVHCAREAKVPPRSEILLAVSMAADGAYLIESHEKQRNNPQPVVARTLSSITGNAGFIRVANPTDSALVIPRGATVGKATPLQEIEIGTFHSRGPPGSIKDIKISNDLSPQDRTAIQALLQEYCHLFSTEDGPVGRTHIVEHEIETGDARPIRQNPYRKAPFERHVIEAQVNDMLRKGVIRESTSPWSSPVVLVRKRNGSWRFCVDFRRLNAVSKKDVHPLPRIDDILDVLQGSRFFTTLDLTSGYWQVPIREDDKEKTAFTTGSGLYEFNVVPFGLCNAPATFQRMINKVLASQLWKVCLAYLDDIIVFSRTLTDHIRDLRSILSALDAAGLHLQPKKCDIAEGSIRYLGHVIDGESIRPDPENIRAVRECRRPKNVKETRSFLGLCNYYRRFVKDFARIAQPLTELTKTGVKWAWDAKCEDAFCELKQKLTTNPVLRLFNPSLPIEIHTDACGYGLGAVLVQRDASGEHVVGYASRHLNAAERNYSATEQECLAVVYATRQFRPYIFGVPFTVVTDQASLTRLMTVRNPNGRLIRWSLLLQEFDITLRHRPGARNANADALSRLPFDPPSENQDEIPVFFAEGQRANIRSMQEADPFLKPIMEHLRQPETPVARRIKRAARAFRTLDGVLYRKTRHMGNEELALAVPRSLRREILVSYHDHVTAGHLGIRRTLEKIKRRYFWPKMFSDITRYVLSCPDCQTRKLPATRPAGMLQPLPWVEKPFQRIGMDFLGPLTQSEHGNKYVVVLIDYHTKWVEAVPTPTATAAFAAQAFMNNVVLRHGAPGTVVTDRGQHFVAEMMEELFRLTSTNHARTAAYHPQTNGLCERFNKTLADILSKYVSANHRDWDQFLPYACFAYNSSVHETTGYSPFFLLYGREPTLPIDTMLQQPEAPTVSSQEVLRRWEAAKQLVAEREKRAQETNAIRYNLLHGIQTFSPGDLVYLRMPTAKKGKTSKFLHPYHGPFRVVRQTAENDWEIESRRGRRDVVNVNRMKRYVERNDELHSSAQHADDSKEAEEGTRAHDVSEDNEVLEDGGVPGEVLMDTEGSDTDDDVFVDAHDQLEPTTPPNDIDQAGTSTVRPRRKVTRRKQDDFLYY